MYASDYLANEIRKWNFKDNIFIQLPTGAGKTTFVTETLYKNAKDNKSDLYYFCNRSILKMQVKEKICQSLYGSSASEFYETDWLGNIRIFTYQKFEMELAQEGGKEKVYKKYFIGKKILYFVFDEFHYFVTDSSFNGKIILFVDFIKYLRDKHRLFARFLYLSATMTSAIKAYQKVMNWGQNREYIGKYSIDKMKCEYGDGFRFYYMEPTYLGDKITFFSDYKEIPSIIKKKNDDEKWLVFIENKAKFQAIRKQMEEFNIDFSYLDAAEANSDSQTYNQIINDGCFSSRVLVATRVLDVGVSILDERLKNIVVTTADYESMVQMVGRKRRKGEEQINIYVLLHGQRYFNSILNLKISPELSYAEYEAVEAYYQVNTFEDESIGYKNRMQMLQRLFYVSDDGKMKKNWLRIQYLQELRQDILSMFQESEMKNVTVEKVFESRVCKWLCIKERDISYCSTEDKKERMKEELSILIQKYINEKIDENKKGELSEKIKNILVKYKCDITFRKDRNLGIKKINDIFKKLELGIMVESRRDSAHREKSHWEVRECEK